MVPLVPVVVEIPRSADPRFSNTRRHRGVPKVPSGYEGNLTAEDRFLGSYRSSDIKCAFARLIMTGNKTLCFLYLITATKAVVSPKTIVKIFLKVEWFQDDYGEKRCSI